MTNPEQMPKAANYSNEDYLPFLPENFTEEQKLEEKLASRKEQIESEYPDLDPDLVQRQLEEPKWNDDTPFIQ